MATIPLQNKKKTAVLLVVKTGFLRQDDFFSEDEEAIVWAKEDGILTVTVKDRGEIVRQKSYSIGEWKTYDVRRVFSRARV